METRAPYHPPDARVADPPSLDRQQLTRGQLVLLVLLVINAATGAFFIVGSFALGRGQSSLLAAAPLLLPLLGFVASASMIRYPVIGLALGIAFYALQAISYFGPEGNWGFRSGLHLSFSVRLDDGALVVNAFAIALSFAHLIAAFKCHASSHAHA